MRRTLVLAVVSVIVGCGSNQGAQPVPAPQDTGFPVFDAEPPKDTGTVQPDTGVAGDSNAPDTMVTDTGKPGDAFFPDVTSKDTAISDAVVLIEGGPVDVGPDTELPDALSMFDTGPADTPSEIGFGM